MFVNTLILWVYQYSILQVRRGPKKRRLQALSVKATRVREGLRALRALRAGADLEAQHDNAVLCACANARERTLRGATHPSLYWVRRLWRSTRTSTWASTRSTTGWPGRQHVAARFTCDGSACDEWASTDHRHGVHRHRCVHRVLFCWRLPLPRVSTRSGTGCCATTLWRLAEIRNQQVATQCCTFARDLHCICLELDAFLILIEHVCMGYIRK